MGKLPQEVIPNGNRELELTFSGGGMRAAAFSLGVFLYFRQSNMVDRIAQISSVSGGSLTNAFLAQAFTKYEDLANPLVFFGVKLARGLPLERMMRRLLVVLATLVATTLILTVLAALSFLCSWPARSGLGMVSIALYSAFFLLNSLALARTLPDHFLRAWFKSIIEADDTVVKNLLAKSRVEQKNTKIIGGKVSRRDKREVERAHTEADTRLHVPIRVFFIAALFPTRKHYARIAAHYASNYASLQLRDIKSPIRHVFSATDLRHGEHFHLSQSWLFSDTYGVTDPRDLLLEEALHASAAFPGALPPVRIPTSRLALPKNLIAAERWLTLVDGGVRDNLGHPFNSFFHSNKSSILSQYGTVSTTIIVDASAPKGVADLAQGFLNQIPLIRTVPQLTTFPRVLGVMNQSNSEARSLALDTILANNSCGFVASIRQNPIDTCRRWISDDVVVENILANHADNLPTFQDERRNRATRALARITAQDGPAAEARWNSDVELNSSVPTTLGGIGLGSLTRLMRHGFTAAMVSGHIEYDWPLADPLPLGDWPQ